MDFYLKYFTVKNFSNFNQSRFFFVHYTADIRIKTHACGRKKGISDKTIGDTLKYAPIKTLQK